MTTETDHRCLAIDPTDPRGGYQGAKVVYFNPDGKHCSVKMDNGLIFGTRLDSLIYPLELTNDESF